MHTVLHVSTLLDRHVFYCKGHTCTDSRCKTTNLFCKVYTKSFLLFPKKEHSATQTYQSLMEWVFFIPSFDQQHLLWWLISLVQEVPTLHRSQASGGMADRMRDGGKDQSRRGETMLGERKSSMCRSRVARGHFTLMADGPIEMTAALHDLKVRRQRIIFQWWRRGIGGVKWCLSTTTTTTPPPPPPPLLNYCRTAKMEST